MPLLIPSKPWGEFGSAGRWKQGHGWHDRPDANRGATQSHWMKGRETRLYLRPSEPIQFAEMDPLAELGTRIIEIRCGAHRDISARTVSDLAEYLGVSRAMVSRAEAAAKNGYVCHRPIAAPT
jgi:hypothetical protein